MNKKIYLGLFIFLWGMLAPAIAQKGEKQIKTLFVYNFTRYIQWPDNNGVIKIGILGNDKEILASFKDMASKKSTGGAKIVIEEFTSPAQSSNYQLVYVPASNSKVITSLAGLSKTLIVSEKNGMTQKGSDINFIHKDGKIRFEINKKAIESSQLKVAGQLMGLAIVV